MKTSITIPNLTEMEIIREDLKKDIAKYEVTMDELCSIFSNCEEDLQIISAMNNFLNEMYSDLEIIDLYRQKIYN
jgi:hypothetical protein